MQLCIDIGNTRVKIAVYENDKEVYFHRADELRIDLILKLKEDYNLVKCILSSTRILEEELVEKIKEEFELHILDESSKLSIQNKYGSPKTLGKDRIAAAEGANHLFPQQNCIIIDAGTCLTYNFLNKEGQYLGGNISPGLKMRLEAMNYFTDKLPLVEMRYNEDLLGKTTEMALQNGAIRGAIYEISAFIEHMNAKYGESKIILTGGDSIIFVKHLNFKIFAHPNLVLLGLNRILSINTFRA